MGASTKTMRFVFVSKQSIPPLASSVNGIHVAPNHSPRASTPSISFFRALHCAGERSRPWYGAMIEPAPICA